ncbi:hypothetical protein OE749_08795 [Aestuariibacter sp. AA17]|uniref:Uncharacterized protein n=1 Tax=Fluctibacter corallii TaxID=2984329 RepID=A0ABT3A7Y7_9ALTE|nr:hypothetical protein [Aestuariibacter sp. AA17]MCV2884793.1 hypothetical protein [Aestuariibacter sp. AA17]
MKTLPFYLFALCCSLVCTLPVAVAATHSTAHFDLHYPDALSASAVDAFATDIEQARQRVTAYLANVPGYTGTPIKGKLQVHVSSKHRTPYQDKEHIYVPEKRVLKSYESEGEHAGLALVHELTHVYAVSGFRYQRDRFYDDGLAVFLQHRLGTGPEYPDFGEDLIVAAAKLSEKHGELIPLKQAENVRGAAKSGVARRLAYLQEGAFSQFLIERLGLEAYWQIYTGTPFETVAGRSFESFETEWAELVNAM